MHILLHVAPSRNVLTTKVNDSKIIKNSMILGSENVSGNPLKNHDAVTSRTALKTVVKNSENVSSRIQKAL